VKPNEIKAELIKNGVTLREVADQAECLPSQVTMCINGNGLYQRVREVIAGILNKPVNRVFTTHHPKPKRTRVNRAAKAA
jgi:lambda repressor-like predicted transcriptional regulator